MPPLNENEHGVQSLVGGNARQDGITFRTKGAKETIAALNELGKRIRTKIIKKALREGGKIILREARARAPVKTKKLRKSIKIRVNRAARRRNVIQMTIAPGTREELGISPSRDVAYYPAVLEYGSAKRNIHPRAYMRSAENMRKDQAQKHAEALIREMIKMDWSKIARRTKKPSRRR